MKNMRLWFYIAIAASTLFVGCSRSPETGPTGPGPSALGEVPAVRLNYRYEADVPPPPETQNNPTRDERNPAIQADFDQNRPQEILDRTIASPDSKRVLAIYHKPNDQPLEFRLDMYAPEGRLLNKITADAMAAHFPDTIRWSPDSSTVAFVAMVRGVSTDETSSAPALDPETSVANQNTATGVEPPSDTNANVDANVATAAPTPAAPTGILTFRTEQIYICDADGLSARAITQNEGLIYFYYVWSPDSTMLAALAAKSIEWRYLNDRAETSGEIFVPVGRPRVVEKNGRERRLDDALTDVQPVWSPDSTKVACAFEHQIRLYDSSGTAPTQAAIPLRNNLLISSQVYDRDQQAKLNAENIQTETNAAPPANSNAQPSTLPDEKLLVSFNPIVALGWPSDELLYFQTAYIKRMKNEADSVTSFPRWHRLVLTPQATK